MWIVWSVLVLFSIGMVIARARLLVLKGIAPPGREWSAGQIRLLQGLRVAGCIGLVIIWATLVYVLIDLGGAHLTEPWNNRTQLWASVYSLLYTSFVLGLLQTPNFVAAHAYWRPSRRLGLQGFIIAGMFVAALASIADLYLPPPTGSRPAAELSISGPGAGATVQRGAGTNSSIRTIVG